jgi:hypothetical protein
MPSVNLKPYRSSSRPLSFIAIILSEAKDLSFIRKNQLIKRERPKEANLANRAEGASARTASTPYG